MTRRRPLLEISLRWRESAVLRKQVALIQDNFPVSLLASAGAALGITWAMWSLVTPTAISLWLVSHLLIVVTVHFVIRSCRQYPGDPHDNARTLVGCMAVMGLSWGSLALVALQYGQKEALLYVLVVMGGVCSGAMGLATPLFPAYLAYLVSPVGLVALAFALSGGPVSIPMVSLIMVYFTLTCIQARNAEEATYRSLLLQIENQALVHRLQLESKQSQTALARSEAAQLQAQQAQAQAETANADKSKFLAAASHDLRQPLHAMGLFLEALTRSEMTAQQIIVLEHAHAASSAASEMLTTLLDFSRLEAGVVQPQNKGFLLQPLISKLEQEFGVQADANNLVYRTRETNLAAMADPQLTDLVVRNFISNAIRYTDSGGVLVSCRKRGECVVVEVWDTGVGIAKEQQEEIFKEFHQLGNPERDRRKGLGLGLAIVERISTAMQARVTLHSRLGHGTVFRLWLPMFDGAVIHDDRSTSESPQSLQGMRVLVIDDEEPVRLGMQELLDSWGCICHTADELSAALKCVALLPMQEQPEVILADYRLREGATGGQAIDALRAYLALRGHVRTVPAIIITGDTAPERLREARSSNAAVLHKPVSASALQQALIQLR